jgi:hypothetical protein
MGKSHTKLTFLIKAHAKDGRSTTYWFVLMVIYRGAAKSLARPTSLSIVFSVQGKGGSPTGPHPENRVGDQDTGSPGRPFSSGLQVPRESFPSWSSYGLISTPVLLSTPKMITLQYYRWLVCDTWSLSLSFLSEKHSLRVLENECKLEN